jgi:hypothetical protein
MAFIRRRGNSHQLIETYREDGKVKQRILANLGPHATLEDAIQAGVVSAPIKSSTSSDCETGDTTAGPARRDPLCSLFRWWSRYVGVPPEVRVKQWQALIVEFAERNEPIPVAEIKDRLWKIQFNNFIDWLRAQGVNVVDDTTPQAALSHKAEQAIAVGS